VSERRVRGVRDDERGRRGSEQRKKPNPDIRGVEEHWVVPGESENRRTGRDFNKTSTTTWVAGPCMILL
jgi:hypothetical protein